MEAASTRALIESNAREAADLAGELTLLLDRAQRERGAIAPARMVTRRLSDRLAQVITLERLTRSAAIRPDAWSPVELVEELEHEAVSLAGERIAIDVRAPDLVPQYWFFDRELVSMTLHNALHSALFYAADVVTLEFGMREGYLGFSVLDDAGSFPSDLLGDAALPMERGELNGNSLGIHFARLVAASHVADGRRGHIELRNRNAASGTCFTMWLP